MWGKCIIFPFMAGHVLLMEKKKNTIFTALPRVWTKTLALFKAGAWDKTPAAWYLIDLTNPHHWRLWRLLWRQLAAAFSYNGMMEVFHDVTRFSYPIISTCRGYLAPSTLAPFCMHGAYYTQRNFGDTCLHLVIKECWWKVPCRTTMLPSYFWAHRLQRFYWRSTFRRTTDRRCVLC